MVGLTLLDAYERIRTAAANALASRLSALPRQGAEITCRAGCSACCRQLVVVSPLEAHAIAAHVDANPGLAARIAIRSAAWADGLAAHADLAAAIGAFDTQSGYVSGDEGGALELSYWRTQLPCPFLEQDRCNIYPVRPFACREHHVTSDPALCASDPDAAAPAETRLEYRAVASFVGTRSFGLEDRLIILPKALDYARSRRPDLGRRAAAGEVAQAIETGQRQARRALALIMLARSKGAGKPEQAG